MKHKNNRSAKKHLSTSSATLPRTAKSVFLGSGIALISVFILIIILSAFSLVFNDPNKMIVPFALTAILVSSFIGGFISSKLNSSSALICGLLCGAILLVFYLFGSFIFKSQASSATMLHILGFRICVPIMSVIGAYLGIKPSKPKRHTHKR